MVPFHFGHFKFLLVDVKEVNDKKQTITISMYLIVSWLEPRLEINSTAEDWKELQSGPLGGLYLPVDVLKHLWNPPLGILGLDTFDSKHILNEMADMAIYANHLVMYTARADIIISCQMHFDRYPFDIHECLFSIGSYRNTNETVGCTGGFQRTQ